MLWEKSSDKAHKPPKLGQSLPPVILKIHVGQGQLCPFSSCIWSKATIMENLNEIHAIFKVKKSKNSVNDAAAHLVPLISHMMAQVQHCNYHSI